MCWHEPYWLSAPERWPEDIQTYSTDETQAEARAVKKLLAVAVQEPQPDTDEVDQVTESYDHWKQPKWPTGCTNLYTIPEATVRKGSKDP